MEEKMVAGAFGRARNYGWDGPFKFLRSAALTHVRSCLSFQDEYVAEGIEWRSVEFVDNSACLDLISGRPTGLLSLIDEESRWLANVPLFC